MPPKAQKTMSNALFDECLLHLLKVTNIIQMQFVSKINTRREGVISKKKIVCPNKAIKTLKT